MKRVKSRFNDYKISNIEYRLTNYECRSRARRRHTLQNSTFVNRYSLFKKRDFTQFHVYVPYVPMCFKKKVKKC
jgi:hypothetical protein